MYIVYCHMNMYWLKVIFILHSLLLASNRRATKSTWIYFEGITKVKTKAKHAWIVLSEGARRDFNLQNGAFKNLKIWAQFHRVGCSTSSS